MPTSLLPAFGWTDHSEQTDAAALAARAWHISTTFKGGAIVATMLLNAAPPAEAAKLEAIAAHKRGCTDPQCPIGKDMVLDKLIGADGKYRSDVPLFFTTARDPEGQPFYALQAMATTPEEATKNHYGSCALLVGAISTWDTEGRKA